MRLSQRLSQWARPTPSVLRQVARSACSSILMVGVALFAPKVSAAERVVLTYGPFNRSLSVAELREFADTREASDTLQFFADAANQDLDVIHEVFTQEVRLNLRFLDRVLNSLPGEYILFQTGQVLRTPSDRANIQALRSAFILSASDDNYVSMVELLENYPVSDLVVDGRRLARDVREVRGFVERTGERLSPQLAIAQEILQGLICECDAGAMPSARPGSSVR
ncbi:MAG: alpha/beta hydrolase [Leptolyngbyaceae cyanobacterium]